MAIEKTRREFMDELMDDVAKGRITLAEAETRCELYEREGLFKEEPDPTRKQFGGLFGKIFRSKKIGL